MTATQLIGGRALMVYAIDAEAADFWRQWGFLASKDRTISSSCFDRSQQLQPRSKHKRAAPNTVKACFRCSGYVVRTLSMLLKKLLAARLRACLEYIR